MSGISTPARTGSWLSGSQTPSTPQPWGSTKFEIVLTGDQCWPASVDTIAPMKFWFGEGCTPEPRPLQKTSTSVPLGSTAIWLPRVNTFALLIATGVYQAAP